MSAFQNFARADRILSHALELPQDEVPSFVAHACGGDDELRVLVENLLAAAGDDEQLRPGGALQGPVWRQVTANPPQDGAPDSEHIGPYHLLRILGCGGMAVVYLAERADGAYEQQVALKLISIAGSRRHVERRFVQERQILAALNHPNIASLLDGGTTTEGRPYLVMEYVDGRPIDRYCDEEGLGVEERLRLFVKICAAVQVAHRNLVVHRDLKPSNILVTADGEPKLLDFGIAKLLERDAWSAGATHTRLHERPMTPQYASPEQILGQPITTAADVYALGLLLYELLTGRRAHRLASTDSREVERVVCEELPARPSTAASGLGAANEETETDDAGEPAAERRLSPLRLRRRLRGDLDNIVMMALRKEPERRYGSVEELARDVERHLDGLPVLAHGDSLLYRTKKLLRRRAGTFVAAGLVLASLLGGLVAAQIQARRAKQEARRAEEVSGFLIELLQDADPDRAQGREITVHDVLERAARRIDVELASEPAVQATLETVMGRVYRRLGSFAEADELLQHALETRRRLFGPEHLHVAETGEEHAWTLIDLGRWQEAEVAARQSLAVRRRRLGTEHPEVAKALVVLAYALRLQGELAGARTALEEATEIERATLGATAPALADTLATWARIETDAGNPQEAETLARRALAIHRRSGPERSRGLAQILQTLSYSLLRLGKQEHLAEAETLLLEAIDIERALLGEDHPRIAHLLSDVASVRGNRFDFAGGEAALLEALRTMRTSLGDSHPEVAGMLNDIAVFYHRQQKWPEAIDYYHQALSLTREVMGDEHPEVGTTEAYLGLALHMSGDEEAESVYRSALDHLLVSRGPAHEKVGNLRNDLGRLLLEEGRYAEAEPHLRQALSILQPIFGYEDQRTDNARANLGYVLCRLGRVAEGEALLTESRAWRTAFYGGGSWTLAEADLQWSACLVERGDMEQAREIAKRSLERLREGRSATDPLVRLATRIRDELAAPSLPR